MLTRRHVLPPSLLGEMARHRLVQNARSRSNSKTASLYPECNQTCAVHAHEHTAQNQTNFHVNGWASGPCKLKAFSMGINTFRAKGNAEAIPFYKRALELDPNFAVAYASLGLVYGNLGQASLAAENIKKAYELRDRVSEREKYRISALYYEKVTGELEQTIQVYELWGKSYPKDVVPPGNLAVIYAYLGQIDKSLAATEESQRLAPDAIGYSNLAGAYVALNRLDDAQRTID